MALSGRVNGICKGSNYTKYSLWIDWIINSQSAAGSKSNMTIALKVQRNDGVSQSAYNLNGTNPVSLSVGGVVKVSKGTAIDTRNNKIVTLATWTGDVLHNADGTLSLTLSGSFSISGTSTLTGGSVSGVATINPIGGGIGRIKVKINNAWVSGIVWLKINGSWCKAKCVYVKSGDWKKSV